MSKSTLFADDINLILVSPDLMQLKSNLVAVLGKIVDWFQANSLTLNQKRHILCILIQKRIIRIILNESPKISCQGLFRRLNILPFYSQYIYSLLLLAAKNASKFVINNEIYMINTRQSTNLHLPLIKLSKYKKGSCYMGIKLFNHLPQDVRKLLYDVKKFKVLAKNCF
jgi:hypothetical protein